MQKLLPYLAFLICPLAFSQSMLKASTAAWHGLSGQEKAVIQQKYLIETVNDEAFGTIIDNQAVDRSTPGTSGGTALGGAIASATYSDRAFNNDKYSAKTHLGAILIGGLVGSTLDSKPLSQFQFRYAIKLGNGNIIYQDIYSADPFRHPVGVCVLLPELKISPEQHLCTQTTASLRGTYIQIRIVAAELTNPLAKEIISADQTINKELPLRAGEVTTTSVSCKLNTLAPVRTSAEKCKTINGVVLND